MIFLYGLLFRQFSFHFGLIWVSLETKKMHDTKHSFQESQWQRTGEICHHLLLQMKKMILWKEERESILIPSEVSETKREE